MVVVSVIELAMHCYCAAQLSRLYGTDAGEPLWAAIVISSLICLVAMVRYRLTLQSASEEQQNDETTGMIVLLAAIHPEFLKCLLSAAEKSHSVMIAICQLDLLRSFGEGVVCAAYSLTFLIQQKVPLKDRRPPSAIVELDDDTNQTASLLRQLAPPQTFPPPLPPAPPPAPPTDLSGTMGWLLLISFTWSVLSLSLKVMRYVLHLELDRRALRRQLDVAGQPQLGEPEQKELACLRGLYYGQQDQPQADYSYGQHIYGQQAQPQAYHHGQQSPEYYGDQKVHAPQAILHAL